MAERIRGSWGQRVVVVTGASAGVGRATALEFAVNGASVALLAREPEALEDTRSQIAENGGTALAIPVDVADAEAVFSAARQVEDAFGPTTCFHRCGADTVRVARSVMNRPATRWWFRAAWTCTSCCACGSATARSCHG